MKHLSDKEAVSELTYHRELVIERLATASNRYERIAYEDEIVAVEALISGFVARQADHAAASKGARDDS